MRAGFDIKLALARSQGAPKGAIEAKVFPQLMEDEDVAKALRRIMRDFRDSVIGPTKHPG